MVVETDADKQLRAELEAALRKVIEQQWVEYVHRLEQLSPIPRA